MTGNYHHPNPPVARETSFRIAEEFIGGNNASGQIGTNGWFFEAIGSGGGTAGVTSVPYPQCGVTRLFATALNGGGSLSLAFAGASNFSSILARAWKMTWIANLGHSTNIRLYFGFGDGSTALQTHGVGFRYDTTLGDATWKAYLMNLSSQNVANTGIALSTSAYVRFQIVTSGDGSVSYFINGAQVARLVGGGPPAATFLRPQSQLIASAAETKHWNVDHFSYEETINR